MFVTLAVKSKKYDQVSLYTSSSVAHIRVSLRSDVRVTAAVTEAQRAVNSALCLTDLFSFTMLCDEGRVNKLVQM